MHQSVDWFAMCSLEKTKVPGNMRTGPKASFFVPHSCLCWMSFHLCRSVLAKSVTVNVWLSISGNRCAGYPHCMCEWEHAGTLACAHVFVALGTYGMVERHMNLLEMISFLSFWTALLFPIPSIVWVKLPHRPKGSMGLSVWKHHSRAAVPCCGTIYRAGWTLAPLPCEDKLWLCFRSRSPAAGEW